MAIVSVRKAVCQHRAVSSGCIGLKLMLWMFQMPVLPLLGHWLSQIFEDVETS